MTSAPTKNRHTIQSIGQKLDRLFDVVGLVLVEQTAMRDDISDLKGDVSELKNDVFTLKSDFSDLKMRTIGLENSNQSVRSDLASFRVDFNDFRDETKQELNYIQEDIRVILPNHERRIAHLEGRRAPAA